MHLIQKLWRGDDCRKTRFHDEKGNAPSLRRIVFNGSRAYWTGIGRILFDSRPESPWLSYDATEVIRKHLSKRSRVLEFGSGMSTIWYARNTDFVLSIEDCEPWYHKVKDLLSERGLTNARCVFAQTEESYTRPRLHADGPFDLIVVDGSFRSECLRQSIDLLAPNGVIYLDNSDKDSGVNGGDMRQAEAEALKYAKTKSAKVIYYTDYSPTQFTPNQGLMIHAGVPSEGH